MIDEKSLTIRNIIECYRQRLFSPQELFDYYYYRYSEIEVKHQLNSIITLVNQEQTRPLISANSIPIGHKDIYSTEGLETTAASNILRGYIPPYNATSVERLNNHQFVTLAKLNCDAFAHGATGENSDFGPTRNPYDLTRVPGGSSSGSAAAVAAGLVPAATATDTGGSIRFPASFTNTVGLKPTYGRVSRYGVIAMTSSTDSIGHITRTVWDSAYLLNITAGQDELDATSSHQPKEDYLADIDRNILPGLKLGVPTEYLAGLDPKIAKIFQEALHVFKRLGAIITEISLPHTEYAIHTYYILTPSEISSNLARFDGIRFGRDRSQVGAEAKRRIILGTFCLSAGYYDAYYLKAQKVRTLVLQDFQQAFRQVDAIVAPVSSVLPPKIGELIDDPIKNYLLDALLVPANLAGIPGLAIPAGFIDHLPMGIQLLGDHFQEKKLFQIGYQFERETQYYKQRPQFTEGELHD